jgi:hypothetical protein
MTPPTEQTLFEKILEFVESNTDGNGQLWNDEGLRQICDAHDKRLADAIRGQASALAQMVVDGGEAYEREQKLNEQLASAHAATRDQVEVAQRAVDELERVRALLNKDKAVVLTDNHAGFLLKLVDTVLADPTTPAPLRATICKYMADYQADYVRLPLAAPQQEQTL